MASTFGLLNTAYSGLAAARAALDTTGQNVANVGTKGYTRQRVEQQSVNGVGNSALFVNGMNLGQGVRITGIGRITDSLADARVRDTASTGGYWTAASAALSAVEDGLGEPGDTGLSTTLTTFWNAWQGMNTNAGTAGGATALLSAANALTSRLSSGYGTASTAWDSARAATADTVTSVNAAAKQVATLNQSILVATASGGTANELIDQRAAAITTLAGLTGASTRQNANGSVDVILGGLTLVAGSTSRAVQLAATAAYTPSSPARLEFADQPGTALQVDGGSLAAQLTTLGSDGVYARTMDAYDQVAVRLHDAVNAQHALGRKPDGTAGGDFFAFTSTTGPAALTLTVVPKDLSGIAAAGTTSTGTTRGANDGSNADAMSRLGSAAGSPDALWSAFVTGIGAQTQAAATQASVATSAAAAASTAQTSVSGVDLDEETANLVVFQHAYQGAARVMTAVDQMLDTLINHTGLVGAA